MTASVSIGWNIKIKIKNKISLIEDTAQKMFLEFSKETQNLCKEQYAVWQKIKIKLSKALKWVRMQNKVR